MKTSDCLDERRSKRTNGIKGKIKEEDHHKSSRRRRWSTLGRGQVKNQRQEVDQGRNQSGRMPGKRRSRRKQRRVRRKRRVLPSKVKNARRSVTQRARSTPTNLHS